MKEDQKRMPLFEAILEYNEKNPAFFHIPGHRYERGINPAWREKVGDEIFKFDLSETPLTDDLHHASGPIKEAEQLAAELWGADYTHFLVNGSTCGNQAMVVTASHGGAKIAIPRNAHKSVLMGLIIGGGKPVYIMPQIEPEWGLHGGITPGQVEEMFRQNPDCKGVLVVSPTYYGITSDLEGILEKYTGQIALHGGIDNGVVDHEGWTEEEVVAETKKAIGKYYKKYSYIPGTVMGEAGSLFPGVYDTVSRTIAEVSDEIFGNNTSGEISEAKPMTY